MLFVSSECQLEQTRSYVLTWDARLFSPPLNLASHSLSKTTRNIRGALISSPSEDKFPSHITNSKNLGYHLYIKSSPTHHIIIILDPQFSVVLLNLLLQPDNRPLQYHYLPPTSSQIPRHQCRPHPIYSLLNAYVVLYPLLFFVQSASYLVLLRFHSLSVLVRHHLHHGHRHRLERVLDVRGLYLVL